MTDFAMFCEIAEEEERVTPALLIPLEVYAQEIGFFDHLAHLQLDMKEVKHTVRDKAVTQILNIALSSPYNKDIDTELRPDRQAANVVGQEQFPDQSGISRFLRRFTPLQIEDLTLIHGLTLRQYGKVHQGEVAVIDLDGFGLLAKRKRGLDFREFDFVLPERGHVFARKGYFAHYPGKEGYHVFVAYTGQYGEVIGHLLDPGNVSPRSRFYDLYYQVLENLDAPGLRLLFRFDGGITSGEIIEFLIAERHLVISKGNNSRTSRRLARQANNDNWEWVSPNQQANDLGWIKIPNCRYRVRVILLRTFGRDKVVYSHLILNISAEVLSVKEAVDLYNARQTVESMIKESRRVLWIGHLRTSHYWGLQAFVALGFLAHNLLTWFQRDVFGDTGLGDLGLKRFVQDFMRLPARVQKVGRTIRIKLLLAHADARALVTALASMNAKKFGRQLGLPLIWGPGFRGAKPALCPMSLGP
jgi:hypothetical protein